MVRGIDVPNGDNKADNLGGGTLSAVSQIFNILLGVVRSLLTVLTGPTTPVSYGDDSDNKVVQPVESGVVSSEGTVNYYNFNC